MRRGPRAPRPGCACPSSCASAAPAAARRPRREIDRARGRRGGVRVYLTGGSGFVGSNVAHVFARRHAAEVVAPSHAEVDLVDPSSVRHSVEAARPDAVVHCAILNDWSALTARRRTAWDAYVGATRNVVDAANAVGAPVLLVSTDWVFDGTQGPAAEDEPPNPVNAYGFYKAASEL